MYLHIAFFFAEFKVEGGVEKMLNERGHFSSFGMSKIQTGGFLRFTCLIWRGSCLQNTRLTERKKESLNPSSIFKFVFSGQRIYNNEEIISR
jgi:hypothetical protein